MAKDSKLKIVTHHWGNNWNKGFNIYSKLDKLIGEIHYKDLIEFTFIGNTPKGFSFENTKLIGPLSGHELADAIKQNNLYLTASINEPSGNHHIEGGNVDCQFYTLKVEEYQNFVIISAFPSLNKILKKNLIKS